MGNLAIVKCPGCGFLINLNIPSIPFEPFITKCPHCKTESEVTPSQDIIYPLFKIGEKVIIIPDNTYPYEVKRIRFENGTFVYDLEPLLEEVGQTVNVLEDRIEQYFKQ